MDRQEYHGEFRHGWRGGPGICGAGSDERWAAPARRRLAEVCEWIEREITGRPPSILEIGCGDLQWHRRQKPTRGLYYGIDIERRPHWMEWEGAWFSLGDARTAPLPVVDLVVARAVFIHLSNDAIAEILANVSQVSRFLLASHHPAAENAERSNEAFHIRGEQVSLTDDPFRLRIVQEFPAEHAGFELFSVNDPAQSHQTRENYEWNKDNRTV